MSVTVDIDEVQANVLYGYGEGYDHARYLRLRIRDRVDARDAVARWSRSGLVTFSNGRKQDVRAHANLAFGFRGLSRLGVPEETLSSFPEDFRDGARRRAGEFVKDNWHLREPGKHYQECDVFISVLGKTPEACSGRITDLGIGAFDVVADRWAALRDESEPSTQDRLRERFGFADGRSQPAIEGVDVDPVGDGVYAGLHPTRGRLRRRVNLAIEEIRLKPMARAWRLIRPGEFLLGYENEDGVMPVGPPPPLGPNGTYMVYREMDQYRATFERYVAQQAARVGMTEDELAAKIIGRWKDGTPVARPPEEPDIAAERRRANDFRYEDDAHGFGCPLGAHVRRANPRDALPGGAERTMRHRIIRRGMPYGSWKGTGDDQAGLAFICFSASIENGFEFIQREWINTGEAFGLGNEPDFLLQQPDLNNKLTGKTVIQGYRPIVLPPPPKPFVSVRGCEYLFVPSRRALAWLSQLG